MTQASNLANSVPEVSQPLPEAEDHERHPSYNARDKQRPDGVRHCSPEPLD